MTPEEADAEAVEAAARAVHQARSRPSDPTWDNTTAFWRGICRTEAQAARAAYLAALEARGCVVVPLEPTREMVSQTKTAIRKHNSRLPHNETADSAMFPIIFYRAMLAARPKVTP